MIIALYIAAARQDVIGLRIDIISSPWNAFDWRPRPFSHIRGSTEKQHIIDGMRHLLRACGGLTNINSHKTQRRPIPGTARFVERRSIMVNGSSINLTTVS